ncbi:Membrane protein involved in the export of O-antigen and teichoic acid [Terriglobus roseus]|uniref:Membrane protein involved in the export of O-antigen and teichoic acid n=2 Tax=Terriglobus roseus TaxID=392734 RepID=A0A1G7FUK4_9BACT|nr:Membrane protein involved in the export of O-antigen and teichoic acid [Terriglobus roseus]
MDMAVNTREASNSSASRAGALTRTVATASTRLLDLPTRYGLHLLIALRLGIEDVGAFYIVFSVMTMASGLGRLGVDRAMTREVAAALGRDLPSTARRIAWRGMRLTLVNSAVITAALVLLSKPIALYILHKPAMAIPLAIGAISIFPQNIANAAAGVLAGLGRVATSQMIYQWLWPALFCAGALVMHLDVNRTLLLIVAAMLLDAAFGVALMLRVLPVRHAEHQTLEVPSLSRLGVQLFSAELLQLAISSAPPFVLGIAASTTEVARYAVVWRIVLLLNLLVSAMAAVASPQFASASARGDRATLRRVAQQTVGITAVLSVLPTILLAINPTFFLNRFGAGYAPAAPAMRILLLGQLSLILCTGVPELLGMTGHARTLLKINAVSIAVLLLGLGALTPHFSDAGAAAGTALAMLVNAVGVSFAARRDLGLTPLWNFLQDGRLQLRRRLSPATPEDAPIDEDIADVSNV